MKEQLYSRWSRIWPFNKIYYAGWQDGHEVGIDRGWFQTTGKSRDEWEQEIEDE